MKILHSADWHIRLHAKKIPIEWQKSRFRQFFTKLLELEKECDIHILAGDIFDKKPQEDEVCLFLEWAHQVSILTYIIPGNHEATKKGETFLESFKNENVINNPLVKIITKNNRIDFNNQGFCFFPYGEMQIDNLPIYTEDDILVTHIRGEVPPHISAEYDFTKLGKWKLVLIGDLHFPHKYQNYPVYYAGSPMNVVFDRENSSKYYGVNIVDFRNINDYDVNFVDLGLPKLIRRTVEAKNTKNIEKDLYNHVIYEVEGKIDELGSIDNTTFELDKKIVRLNDTTAQLNLNSTNSILEELSLYLDFIEVENKENIMKEFQELGIDQ